MLPDMLKIRTKEQLRQCLSKELPFYECGYLQRFLHASEKSILRKHQILLRKTEYYSNSQNWLFALWYRFRLNKLQNRHSIHIPINCCETGLHIMHLGPILINSHAWIGSNCTMHINTAVVANGISGDAPHLGNGIVLGIGAVIVGPVFLADHVAVGANALVNRSFEEENIAVAGVPAKRISNNGSLEWNKKKDGES